MRGIRLEQIYKTFNKNPVLKEINLTIPGGTFFALLGPSGSGKTTLLRLIAGFEKPDSGDIILGDQSIVHLPSNKRPINTVFQHYALFPHMDVFDNVAYSLVVNNVPRSSIEQKVWHILTIVHLEKQMHQRIDTLSGGQKQRVALARSIINEPEVLLFDESLSALDRDLREKMLLELISLQESLKTTFVYVTHDQFEALTVADYMAIMKHDGTIEQVGTPREVYEFPTSLFVARFVGNTNVIKGIFHVQDKQIFFEIEGLGMFSIVLPHGSASFVHRQKIFMSIRPEKIHITTQEVENFSNNVRGIVESIVYHGRSTQYNVRLKNNLLLQVFKQNEKHISHDVIDYDDQVYLYWHKENVVLLER